MPQPAGTARTASVVPCRGARGESWRLFQLGTGDLHFVVGGRVELVE
jgi:hypothetical protein